MREPRKNFWRSKVVIVTGGSAGLGLAIAAAFARRGAELVIAGRGERSLAQAERMLAAFGGAVLAVQADVTVQAAVDALVARAAERFGRIDVLVNNVGRSARGEIVDTPAEQFAEMVNVNLLSAVRCTRAAMPYLLARRGHVVNIGSLASKSAARYLGAYPAAKFALAGYTQQLRLELSPRGLHVLLVCPGPIARDEQRQYSAGESSLPAGAHLPGGGVRISGLDPDLVAHRIVRACERRQVELILPGRARLLFAIAQLAPKFGDWIVRKMTT